MIYKQLVPVVVLTCGFQEALEVVLGGEGVLSGDGGHGEDVNWKSLQRLASGN